MNIRNRKVSLLFLNALFHDRPTSQIRERDQYILLLNTSNHSFGVVVDDIDEMQEVVITPPSPILRSLSLYAGSTVLENGKVALILDPVGLYSQRDADLKTKEEDQEDG